MSGLGSLVARIVAYMFRGPWLRFNWDIQTHKDGNIIWASFVYSRANNLKSMENI